MMSTARPLARPWWSSLSVKLFGSYLLVMAVGVGTLVVAATLATPSFFDLRMAQAMGTQGVGPGGRGGMGPGSPAMVAQMDEALAASFRGALGQGLLLAAMSAVAAAGAASVLVSRRIAGPISRLAIASHRIADGNYRERVIATGRDELGELGRSFNAMAVALEATEQRRLELIGDVAHELRTPLATLRGYLEGLIDGVVQPGEATWAKLHDEVGRLQRLVDDLQELSRAEAHQLSLRIQPVAAAELANTVVERLAPAFADKGVALGTEIDPPPPAVLADSDRALQVLTNLLSNALRYTPAGGAVRVHVAHGSTNDVAFTVTDTGVGIPPQDMGRIFERFYRVDKSRSRAHGGSGIGLTISRALVEAMGGQIWAESAGAGRGARLTFTLPRVR